ncbi:hypothetical protein JKF63_00277 [Porcisia hertigi]|uniref:Uncharacterized protein n=1 Tax=Porcisia hertigi TaxID=2761500 RepID=A0A836HYS6_9TRYP|nr:hypothetical protein JKF63_00277 [Porcisia hertigi]
MRPHSSRSGSITRKVLSRASREPQSHRREDYTPGDGVPRRSRHQHEPAHFGHDSLLRSLDGDHRRLYRHTRSLSRPTRSPIRLESRTSSLHRRQPASTEPHMPSSQSSSQHHRHLGLTTSTTFVPVTEAPHLQDTLQYRSFPHAELAAKRKTTPHRSYRHHFSKVGPNAEREAQSSRRHASAHHSHSQRRGSRHHSERSHRHHRTSTPASVDERSRSSCHTPHVRPLEVPYAVPPPQAGSAYVRRAANNHITGRPRSGSCIEIISVHSKGEGSTNGWTHSRSSVPHTPRRLQDNGLPVVIPSPQRQHIMERIDSTRLWLHKMKEDVQKEHELQRKEDFSNERAPRHSARKEHREATPRADRRRSDRTSSTRSRRRASAETRAVSSRPASADARVTKIQSKYDTSPPKSFSGVSIHSVEQPAPSKHEKRHRNRSRAASTAPPASTSTPHTAALGRDLETEVMDSNNGSRQGDSHHPISFVSFLDGSRFDSTASLCQYNATLAESLSDEHLDILRSAVFGNNEDAFAELLYGDEVEAEVAAVAETRSHRDDPTAQRELVALQQAVARRFNKKCAKALKILLAAKGGLAEAVQVAASQLGHQSYQVNQPAAAATSGRNGEGPVPGKKE